MVVTWDPNNNSGMILSNGNLTASSPDTGEDSSVYVEATQPIQPGDKVFFQIDVSGGNGKQPGYAGGAGTAFGGGFAYSDPNSDAGNYTAPGDPAYGYPLGNTITTPAPATASLVESGYDGDYDVGGHLVEVVHRGVSEWADPSYVDYALDRTTNEFWVYSSTTGEWNNSSTADPATDTGGWDASALGDQTVYAIVSSQAIGNQSATLVNNDADIQGSVPAGFTTLQDLGNGGSSTATTSPPSNTTPTSPSPVTIGSGSDSVVLQMSEDAWNGDAQFTVSVDGTQIDGTQTTTASHAAGQEQAFTVEGDFGAGSHQVTVNFLNDAYGGTPSTDRNLYVDSSTIDGTAIPGGSLALYSGGPQSFGFQGSESSSSSSSPPATTGSGSDSLVLQVSEDAWRGNARFTVSVDGTQIGGTQTATASHAAGQEQAITLEGNFGAGSHQVTVNFLNDAYRGTPSTDRNLYVDSSTIDGTAIPGGSLALYSGGPQSFSFAMNAET